MENKSILVIDDEPGIALLCKRLLTREGYIVESYTDPREAVKYLAGQMIDLLLVDIRMPEVDGFEVIEHTQKEQPDEAILIMTGHGTVETAIRALRQGVDGLILKPFSQGSDLIEAVKQAFDDSQQKRDASRTKALRPLFAVTETLLSETNHEKLLELITFSICEQLRCSFSAYHQQTPGEERLVLLSSHGSPVPHNYETLINGLVSHADNSKNVLMIKVDGVNNSRFKPLLTELEFETIILSPVYRPNFIGMLIAARRSGEPPFHEADLEMLQILGRQAGVAMENSRLYAQQIDYIQKMEESQRALIQAEKMATAGRLSASIAHEVNNPLQAVQNCLHLASRDDIPVIKQQEYVALARTELERLMLTVRRMLDFYRPGATSFEKVDIGDVIQYVVKLLSKQLTEAGITIHLNLSAGLPNVLAVANQLQQVFINLILNASDAMPGGGKLHIKGRVENNGVEILFMDSGSGIPLDKQENIFEPFFSTKQGGSGLGLTVSYNIVTAHGGILELVKGHKGPGACFRVFLPIGGKDEIQYPRSR